MIEIEQLMIKQRKFFQIGRTKSRDFRMKALNRLEKSIRLHEESIHLALQMDLGKSGFEAYMSEVGMVYSELAYVKRHLRCWDRDRKVATPLAQFPSRSFIKSEPYGLVLIMAPWNYPFMLSLDPLIGAIAAGNCCIVKPSAYAPHTSAVIKLLLEDAFPEQYVAVVEGGRAENTQLLEQRFDYIFFTGGVSVGKLVMEKAAAHLTPMTLELGGKSPCVVEESADLNMAAKRLVFGKFLNSGQTCVAPDYVLVQESVKEKFLVYVKSWIVRMFGDDVFENSDYSHIVNRKHFKRLLKLMKDEEVLIGGGYSEEVLQIEPTVLYPVDPDAPVMQEEIFGPILPVLTFGSIEEAKAFILEREKPLALYLFTSNRAVEKEILRDLSFGGGCINDTIIHLATSRMGFGGVGNSGMGSYHGKKSFETFSHEKSIVKKSTSVDLPIRYQPYGICKEKLLKIFLR